MKSPAFLPNILPDSTQSDSSTARRIEDLENGTPTKTPLSKIQNVNSTSGKAIPLCLPNDYEWDGKSNTCTKKSGEVKRHSLFIVPEAVKILERITNPISVVAIAGPSCTGKSYLLNQLIPSKKHEGSRFQIMNTLDPVTMGIWMWDTPFVHTLENEKEVTVILLDTEGVDAVNVGRQRDTQVFTLSVLLSSPLIYNSKDCPKRESLSFITNLAKSIGSRGAEMISKEEINQTALSFLWLLRDAFLQPENSQGSPCTFLDYLLEKVLAVPKDAPVDDIQAQASKCLREFFFSFDAEMIPLPSDDPSVIDNLKDPSYKGEINPRFLKQIEHVCYKILNNCQPKKGYTKGSLMNGIQFTEILRMYVDALNSEDGIPKIGTAWDQAMKNLYQTATRRAKEIYKKAMDTVKFPIEENDLEMYHEKAYDESVKLFNQLTKLDGDRDAYAKNLEKLTAIIGTSSDSSSSKSDGGLFYLYYEENQRESQKHCQRLLTKLKANHIDPILANLSHETSFESIRNDVLQTITPSYYEQSIGPAKQDEFKNFMEIFQKEEKQAMLSINRMKNYNDQLNSLAEQYKKDSMKREEELKSQVSQLQNEVHRLKDKKCIIQ